MSLKHWKPFATALIFFGLAALGGCTCRLALKPGEFEQHREEGPLPGRSLGLCYVKSLNPQPPKALILFATGDAGWMGMSKTVFENMAEQGYDLAGLNSRAYLKFVKRHEHGITPAHLAADYASIIDEAMRVLGLPGNTPTILVGLSRGSEFVVVAAGQKTLQPRLAGAVAMALTRETDYVRRRHFLRRRSSTIAPGSGKIATYPSLQRLDNLPIAVIQSTHDHYVPAEEARRLFGPDTPSRRLYAIEASSHGFRGGRDVLLSDLESALRWILSLSGPEPDAPPSSP